MRNMDKFGEMFKQVFSLYIKIVHLKTSKRNRILNKSALEILSLEIRSYQTRAKIY